MNEQIKEVVLQYIKNEPKTAKSGKPYTACSIKVADQWINGFGNDVTKGWQAGDRVKIKVWKEPYNGKEYLKFKTLSQIDLLEERVTALEQKMIQDPISTPNTPEIANNEAKEGNADDFQEFISEEPPLESFADDNLPNL